MGSCPSGRCMISLPKWCFTNLLVFKLRTARFSMESILYVTVAYTEKRIMEEKLYLMWFNVIFTHNKHSLIELTSWTPELSHTHHFDFVLFVIFSVLGYTRLINRHLLAFEQVVESYSFNSLHALTTALISVSFYAWTWLSVAEKPLNHHPVRLTTSVG